MRILSVSIQYWYANIRSKFIEISSRWHNIFQSGVIYHSRRRQSNVMMYLKGASCCFPSNVAFMFVSCTKSRNVKFPHQSTHILCFCLLLLPLLMWFLNVIHYLLNLFPLHLFASTLYQTFRPPSSVKTCFLRYFGIFGGEFSVFPFRRFYAKTESAHNNRQRETQLMMQKCSVGRFHTPCTTEGVCNAYQESVSLGAENTSCTFSV